MIARKTIDEVISIAKIEDVVGEFVHLKRRGVNLIGLCPFHDEKTPSFTVSPSKNLCKCFGCGKGGTPIHFIMEHEKMSFIEAIRYLAGKYNIEIVETVQNEEDIQQRLITDTFYIVNQYAKEYFIDTLFKRQEGINIGLSYFKERGFLESTIKKFELGYCTEDKDDFTNKAIKKQFQLEHLQLLGLTNTYRQDFYRGRVIFPIHNISGKVVGFGGRTLSMDKKIPKYINSPESDIYNKRNVLYGMYFAKQAIRKQDECILVEGYTDVISLHQGGIENVVASSGTSLTKEQLQLIKRNTPNIKIIYDGDLAGIKAAMRGLDLVLEADMNVKLVLLPDGQDPDSFLSAQGSQGFQDYIVQHEEDFVFFKTRLLLEEVGNDPIKKTVAIRDIVDSIALIKDPFKRNLYIKQCSRLLDLSEDIFVGEVNKIIRSNLKQKSFQNRDTGATKKEVSDEDQWLNPKPVIRQDIEAPLIRSDAWQEQSVCNVLINFCDKIFDEESNKTVAQYIVENCTSCLKYFDVELYKNIIQATKEKLDTDDTINIEWYLMHENEAIRNFAINVLTTPYVYASWDKREMFLQTQKLPEENWVSDTIYAINRLIYKKSFKAIKIYEEKIAQTPEDEQNTEDYIVKIKVLQHLIQLRNEIATKIGTVTF